MSVSTDAMYNAESRYLHQMLKIHFTSGSPLEVTTSNYLISSEVLEDAYGASDSPFGSVTANELSLNLYNDGGIFNPGNASSPYYGLIKRGIKIEVFVRPDTVTEWDRLGVFYVTEWYTSANSPTVQITANDALYNVLNGAVQTMPVYKNMYVSTFMQTYFSKFGLAVDTTDFIDMKMPFIYTSSYKDNKSFLTALMTGCMADCFCDHSGNVKIVSKIRSRSARATLTDNDQIVTVSVKQSITSSYNSSVVKYVVGQESEESDLLNVSGLSVNAGETTSDTYQLSNVPALSVRQVIVTAAEPVRAISYTASAGDVAMRFRGSSSTEADVKLVGTYLENITSEIGEASDTSLSIESDFIQSKTSADAIHKYVQKYLSAAVPSLELHTRGNPRLQLGDKIAVTSTYNKVSFVGTLIKATYSYNGALTCDLTLSYNVEEV